MNALIRYIFLTLILFLLSVISVLSQEVYSLADCIEIAVNNNISVDKAKLAVESRLLDVKGQRNERLPNLNGFANVYSNFGQSQDIFGNNARNDNFNSTLGLSSSYSLLNNGRIKNYIRKSEREWEASAQDLELVKREITLKTIQAYLNVLLQKEICNSVDTALAFAKNQFEKVQKSNEHGATSLSVLYEAKANYEREFEKNRQAHYAIEKAMLDLKQIMSMEQKIEFEIKSDLNALTSFKESAFSESELYESFSNRNPNLKKYRLLNEAFIFDQKAIKSQFYPNIDLSLTLGSFYFNNLTTGMGKIPLFNQLQNNFSQQVGLTINVPIFNKNSIKLAVQRSKIQQADNAKQLELEQLSIKQDIEKQILDMENFKKQYKLAANVLDVTRNAFDLSLKSYVAGRISIYDLNNSRSNLLTVESELIQSKYNVIFSQVLIHYLSTGELIL